MATEYGGTYGDQPRRDAQPQYLGQPQPGDGPSRSEAEPPEARPPQAWPTESQPSPAPPRRRPAASTAIASLALVLGLVGLVVSLYGVATQLMPRRFTAAQQQQIVNWEYGRDWRSTSAGAIFPTSVSYPPEAALDGDGLTLTAGRIGIAPQASCKTAADQAAAAVLDRNGCAALLRATYTDGTKSYVVTVGVAVMPSTAQASTAARELGQAPYVGGIAPGVRAVAFKNTPAGWFTNARRQLSGASSAGSYVALYTVGYADSRPREPVDSDNYADGEMTSLARGVARAVLAAIAPPVAAPHCPGTPGC